MEWGMLYIVPQNMEWGTVVYIVTEHGMRYSWVHCRRTWNEVHLYTVSQITWNEVHLYTMSQNMEWGTLYTMSQNMEWGTVVYNVMNTEWGTVVYNVTEHGMRYSCMQCQRTWNVVQLYTMSQNMEWGTFVCNITEHGMRYMFAVMVLGLVCSHFLVTVVTWELISFSHATFSDRKYLPWVISVKFNTC